MRPDLGKLTAGVPVGDPLGMGVAWLSVQLRAILMSSNCVVTHGAVTYPLHEWGRLNLLDPVPCCVWVTQLAYARWAYPATPLAHWA